MRRSAAQSGRVSQRVYQSVYGHECNLPPAEDPLSLYLFDGPLVLLRRKLKRLFLISETVPKTKFYFRSTLRIATERHRHLKSFYYTIHPFSKFRFYWEILMAVLLLILIVYLPIFGVTFETTLETGFNEILYCCINLGCICDIVITLFSGYVDTRTDTVVLSLREVFKHYVFGYMIFDVAASLPSTLFCKLFGIEILHWTIMNRYIKIVRYATAIKYLENLWDMINLSRNKRFILRRVIFVLIFLEYLTFIAFFDRIKIFDEFDVWSEMDKIAFKLFYCSLRALCLVKPHFYIIPEKGWFVLVHQFILLQCGNLFNAFMIARFLAVYNGNNQVWRKKERLNREVKEYARYHKLSESTHRTLLQLVVYKFGGHIYDEDLILSTLTPHLKDELLFVCSQKMMEKVELFKEMPTSAVKRIAARLKQEVISPNDVIIQAGHEGSSMYFIIVGIVAVYSISGKEICHLTDGANFGEIALLMNETRTASIVAADFCEVFTLQRKDFQAAIEPFPELKERIIQTARERFATIIAFPPPDTDVLEDQ